MLVEIDGTHRVLDAGQCNDSYILIAIAKALAQAFGVSVNELPAFLSPNVVEVLVKAYELKPIADAEQDVQAMLAGN